LAAHVRVEERGTELRAYLPDGSTWHFGVSSRIDTPRGTYAWYLDSVEDAIGHQTQITYDHNSSGRLFPRTVVYGGSGTDFQYQIEFQYDTFPLTFLDFRPG